MVAGSNFLTFVWALAGASKQISRGLFRRHANNETNIFILTNLFVKEHLLTN